MTVELKFDKTFYFPSQAVEGTVSVYCDYPKLAKSIKLRFYKKLKTTIKKIDGTLPEILVDTETIEKDYTCLICENNDLKSGCNTFPFSFNVKGDETGTGIAKSYFSDTMCILENSFFVQAIYEGSDGIITEQKHLSIINQLKEKTFIDTKIKASTFMCLFAKSINYRIQTDKQWYSRGDTINLSFSSLTKTETPMIASITANLYQLIAFSKPVINTVKSKLITTFSAVPTSKNTFKMQFRVPMSLCPNIADKDFTVQCVIFFNLNLFSGKQIKIKKYLNIGEAHFEIPKIETRLNSENYVYVMRHLDYSAETKPI